MFSGAIESVQWVEVLTIKSEGLDLIHRTHRVGENQLLQVVSDLRRCARKHQIE